MKHILLISLLFIFTACNQSAEHVAVVTTDTLQQKILTDSSAKYIHSFRDTALEQRITMALLKLPFVARSNKYIDSFSNHKQSIAFMLNEPATNETEIDVQAGYNSDERFETYYRFFVIPKRWK